MAHLKWCHTALAEHADNTCHTRTEPTRLHTPTAQSLHTQNLNYPNVCASPPPNKSRSRDLAIGSSGRQCCRAQGVCSNQTRCRALLSAQRRYSHKTQTDRAPATALFCSSTATSTHQHVELSCLQIPCAAILQHKTQNMPAVVAGEGSPRCCKSTPQPAECSAAELQAPAQKTAYGHSGPTPTRSAQKRGQDIATLPRPAACEAPLQAPLPGRSASSMYASSSCMKACHCCALRPLSTSLVERGGARITGGGYMVLWTPVRRREPTAVFLLLRRPTVPSPPWPPTSLNIQPPTPPGCTERATFTGLLTGVDSA